MHWYQLLAALISLVGLASLTVTILSIDSQEDEESTGAEPIVFRLRAS